ncbi:MAG TPA: LysM peptidoglycan-binding domain-containing protein [Ktedonobacteraceae bacterium]|nr:LysM peptidoglycan-binding domain-containing protein [Ktedonobacteraceae bacterium]
MGSLKGSTLAVGQFLAIGDWLQSDNQCFQAILDSGGYFYVTAQGSPAFPPRELWNNGVNNALDGQPYQALMQGDGNFVVWRNWMHEVWASGVAPGGDKGPYIAIMQGDGNFVVYRGTAPSAGNAIWATNTNVFNIARVDVTNLTYDLAHAVLSNPQLAAEYTNIVTNETTVPQMKTFAFEDDYQETQSWSTTVGVKQGIQASIKASIPIYNIDASLGTSTEFTWSTTTGGQLSETKKYTDTIPVQVPPHSQVTCRASVTTGAISVPFSANATFWDTSGNPYYGIYTGTYQGTTAYQLQTTFIQPTPTASGFYIVQSGDTLSGLAQQAYGNGSQPYWTAIYRQNQEVIGNDPSIIQPGQELWIPEITTSPEADSFYIVQSGDTLTGLAQQTYGNGSQPYWTAIYLVNQYEIGNDPSIIRTGEPLYVPRVSATPKAGQFYIVQSSDTLSGLAQQLTGDGSRWPVIYNDNKKVIGNDPNLIVSGQVLYINGGLLPQGEGGPGGGVNLHGIPDNPTWGSLS